MRNAAWTDSRKVAASRGRVVHTSSRDWSSDRADRSRPAAGPCSLGLQPQPEAELHGEHVLRRMIEQPAIVAREVEAAERLHIGAALLPYQIQRGARAVL